MKDISRFEYWAFPGVAGRDHAGSIYAAYRGEKEAIIAAGLACAQDFPGERGQRITIGHGVYHGRPVQIQRRSNSTYRVLIWHENRKDRWPFDPASGCILPADIDAQYKAAQKKQRFARGVTSEMNGHSWIMYRGTRRALLAAGVATEEMFPAPGKRRKFYPSAAVLWRFTARYFCVSRSKGGRSFYVTRWMHWNDSEKAREAEERILELAFKHKEPTETTLLELDEWSAIRAANSFLAAGLRKRFLSGEITVLDVRKQARAWLDRAEHGVIARASPPIQNSSLTLNP